MANTEMPDKANLEKEEEVSYQKDDGAWYFTVITYNPETRRHDLPQEFGPYADKDNADVEECEADAMLG